MRVFLLLLFFKIYLFLAVLGLHFFAWAFSNCDWEATRHWGVRASHCGGLFCR